jgi:hypothetical protein
MRRIGLVLLWFCCARATCAQTTASPSGDLSLSFKVNQAGEAVYQLSYKGRAVIAESRLGLAIKNQPPLTRGFAIVDSKASEADETWEPVWGEVARIRNHHRELLVTLRQTAAYEAASSSTTTDLFSSASDGLGKAGNLTRTVAVRFRVFDDGLGFRYEFPEQEELSTSPWTRSGPSSTSPATTRRSGSRGLRHQRIRVHDLQAQRGDAFMGKAAGEIATACVLADNAVQTPLMLKRTTALHQHPRSRPRRLPGDVPEGRLQQLRLDDPSRAERRQAARRSCRRRRGRHGARSSSATRPPGSSPRS